MEVKRFYARELDWELENWTGGRFAWVNNTYVLVLGHLSYAVLNGDYLVREDDGLTYVYAPDEYEAIYG